MVTNINQKYYKGVEIVYSITTLPEITTDTFSISSFFITNGESDINVRKITNHTFGLTCTSTSEVQRRINIRIDITNQSIDKSETRQIEINWHGTYVQPDKVISTYEKANLLSVAVLRNYATYNITETNNYGNQSLAGAITLDPEKDTPISGLTISQYNDYDDEYNLGKDGDKKFIQNPFLPNFSTVSDVINDNGEYKITVDSMLGNTSLFDMWFNNIDSSDNSLIPPMVANPSKSTYNYPSIGNSLYVPQLMGIKIEVAPDVFLYANQYNNNYAEYENTQVLSWTTIDKTNRDIYKNISFRDENGYRVQNTETIGVMLKTKNFILKSTRNIRKVRIWSTNTYGSNNGATQIDADRGTIQFVNSKASFIGSGESQGFPANQYLHIWQGNSKHIKFALSMSPIISENASSPIVGNRRLTIHSYTDNNQTTPGSGSSNILNPKVYLCDSNGEPTSNYYDGTLNSCAWLSSGTKPLQTIGRMMEMDSTIITLIQVETD